MTAAVVLNWNLAELTLRCVHELLDDGLSADEIIVVDNGSGEEEAQRLRRDLPAAVHLLALPQNIGYARASNAGAAERPIRLSGASERLLARADEFTWDHHMERVEHVLANVAA